MEPTATDPHLAEAGPLFAFAVRAQAAAQTAVWTEQSLSEHLARLLGEPVAVRFSRSRTYPVQATHEPNGRRIVRLHGFFAHASPQQLSDLAAWLRSGRRARAATARLDAYIEAQVHALGPKPLPARLRTRGRHHDLAQLRASLTVEPTAAPVAALDPEPTLSYGRFASRRPRRRLLLGSYDDERGWVRVHPLLDHEDVPAFFVRYVIFHELLHAALPKEHDRAGRVLHHGPAFRRAERAFCDTQPAHAWESANQGLLFRLARRREP